MEKQPEKPLGKPKTRLDELSRQVERQSVRIKQAEGRRHSLLALTAHIGVLGLLFVLPLVGGAYLGRWLDSLVAGYSVRWTVSLILLGVACGGVNVYLFIRE